MKYKFYEKLTDFFGSRVFSKTNIAVVAVMSILMNIVLAGVAYNGHKDLETFLSLYAPERSQNISTTAPAEEITATQKTSAEEEIKETTTVTPTQTEPSSQQTSDVVITQEAEKKEEKTSGVTESEQSQQGTYYVTSSGTKYHKSTCGYLSKSRIAITLSDAKEKGYSPCSRCIK